MMNVLRLDLENEELAVGEYAGAQANRSRFIVAFRHPGDDDPQLVYLALNTALEPALRRAGLPRYPGAVFLAGTEIPLWGGPLVAFALAKAGTIPVSHGVLSKSVMDTIMHTLVDTPMPIALAPEGQVTYYSHVVPDLDQGTAQIGIWAQGRLADRAKKAGTEPIIVNILPVGVIYRFPRETWGRLDRFTRECERMVGIDSVLPETLRPLARKRGRDTVGTADGETLLAHFRLRFTELWEHIVGVAVAFYANTYNYRERLELVEAGVDSSAEAEGGRAAEAAAGEIRSRGARTEERARALCEFAMDCAERYFGYEGSGTLRERVMFLRTHSMKLAFSERPRGAKRTWLERRLAERACADAYWLHRHQELVDLSWYLSEYTVTQNDTFDQAVETAQNLQDLAQRLVGGSFGSRRKYFRKAAVLRFGTPIPVMPNEGAGRKEAMVTLSARLREAFEALLDPVRKGE